VSGEDEGVERRGWWYKGMGRENGGGEEGGRKNWGSREKVTGVVGGRAEEAEG